MDAEVYFALVFAVAASFAQVALHFYLQLAERLVSWYWRGTRLTISRIDIRAAMRGCGVFQSIDAAVWASCRIMIGVYCLPVVFIAIPLGLTIGSLSLAAAVIVPLGG